MCRVLVRRLKNWTIPILVKQYSGDKERLESLLLPETDIYVYRTSNTHTTPKQLIHIVSQRPGLYYLFAYLIVTSVFLPHAVLDVILSTQPDWSKAPITLGRVYYEPTHSSHSQYVLAYTLHFKTTRPFDSDKSLLALELYKVSNDVDTST